MNRSSAKAQKDKPISYCAFTNYFKLSSSGNANKGTWNYSEAVRQEGKSVAAKNLSLT
jgi:hypothetical protein